MKWRLTLGLGLMLLAGCRSERAAFRTPPAAPVVTAPPQPVAPPTDETGVATEAKPALPLPSPNPSAPVPVRAAAPNQYKPAHWPLHESGRKQVSKAPSASTVLPTSPRPREAGISNTVYFSGGTGLAIAGIVVGLIIGGTSGLLIGLLFFVPGYLLVVRSWIGSWKWK